MDDFDDATVRPLVSLAISHILSEKYRKYVIALYRDDDLACFGKISVHQAGGLTKDLIKIFKN